MPGPVPARDDAGRFLWQDAGPNSIGRVRANHGNFLVLARAYTYLRFNGPDGLRHVSESAILNANYIMRALQDDYALPFDRACKHEFVFSASKLKVDHGVTATDIAKRLLDFGIHSPTIYFPLIVPEALLIEPTETETRETLDNFIAVMRQIANEARTEPEKVTHAPYSTPVGRLDQTLAARKPQLCWRPDEPAKPKATAKGEPVSAGR
jgi:glycine dehydrogenase subunit 2